MSDQTAELDEVVRLALTLSPLDKIRLVERLAATLETELTIQVHPGWPAGFFERTYGILADDPIERLPQGDYEEREDLT
jgi:hypothetical protein